MSGVILRRCHQVSLVINLHLQGLVIVLLQGYHALIGSASLLHLLELLQHLGPLRLLSRNLLFELLALSVQYVIINIL